MDRRIKELTDKHYPLVMQTTDIYELEQRLRNWLDEVNSCVLDETQAVRQNEDAEDVCEYCNGWEVDELGDECNYCNGKGTM